MNFKKLIAKIFRILKQNISIVIAIIMLIIAFNIMEDVFENEIFNFDNYVYNHIALVISPKITMFLKLITYLGSSATVITICILSFLIIKNKLYAKLMTLNLVIIYVLNTIIKNVVSRPRPTGHRLVDASGYSFPSGHSMTSMAFYGLIIFIVYRYIKNRYIKWTLIMLLSLLIVLIGVSRIYLGVHYASDVAVGFCISISYLILYINILKRNKIFVKE